MRLGGKVAIVAGAGRGVGRATALLFSQEGAKVALISRTKENIQETAALIEKRGGEALPMVADLSQARKTKECMDHVAKIFGKIDILHCNMGGYATIPFEKMDEKSWDEMINLNLKSKFITVKSALPHLISNGSGSIILTAAIYGHFFHSKNMAHYNASKAGVISLTKSLAVELSPYKIRVNCVCPGPISHEIHSSGQERIRTNPKLHRGGLPEDIAFSVLYFASDDSSWVTGATLAVDGGLSVGVKSIRAM